ncbi:GntR family transcriptional regulator [Pedobacter sp. PLR]|uniref:FadR/GntR family transcriptional regulator n=1 Tax=Pedobacter sp. PLR TaxID=2994465 RepID=UPI0022453F30|nr:GntR family transcriptional regulator [Pedobacter sp. PLR]MCX2450110.1 GntR family transcriptional regulator [Pedobacter sp. PLR]
MKDLKINNQPVTLVDQVEAKLLEYIKTEDLNPGSSMPNEQTLAKALGVARGVLREALSRLRMLGLIETRTQRGMVLKEPSILGGMLRVADPLLLSELSLLDVLEFRVALELGISSDIFRKITKKDIEELEVIVEKGIILEHNEYALASEYAFHSKLYEITGNQTIIQFQKIINPIITFVKDKFEENFKPINIELEKENRIVTHADLLECIKTGDVNAYRDKLDCHFLIYSIFLNEKRKLSKK